MMPRVDGFAVPRHMQHHPEKLGWTIIGSAVPESEILKRFESLVFGIHPKPIDMQGLISEIQKCVEDPIAC